MSKSQRDKGAAGEREAAAVLTDLLGVPAIKRRLSQTRDGGYDLDVLGVAVEVKRQERPSLPQWVRQATEAGNEADKLAAVIHRTNRAPWLVTMSVDDWCSLVREAQG